MARKTTIHIAAYIISFVFISVGFSKIVGHADFTIVLSESPFVKHFVSLIAYPIPTLEVLVGLALLIPSTRTASFVVSFILMVAFTLYNIYLIAFAPEVPCGCGGIFKNMSWTTHLFVNMALTILAWIGVYLTTNNNRLRTTFQQGKIDLQTLKRR